jgi:hypothetical protein
MAMEYVFFNLGDLLLQDNKNPETDRQLELQNKS